MNEDQTINNSEVQQRQEQLFRTQENIPGAEPESAGQYQYAQAQSEPARQQGASLCPVCGAVLPQGADYCENCRRYVKNDVCSFCGAPFEGDGAYCPECGSPR
ncbi:MAG: zinc ribbon domain-containing protein, partial [Prevotella sp.]